VQRFRLPSEAEWEYASRGGLSNEEYPWGGPYTRNYLGCPLANFKPMRGDYPDDNGVHTVPIGSYSPNGWGLYNMAGNVAEWCNTAYDEAAYEIMHDLNPEYDYRAKEDDATTQKRKVIRGGSWKDISYFIQCGSRSYEFQDTAKSYIGFRCVMTYLGRGKSGPEEDWNSPTGNE
jgi:gliding motility-associated lipoprotein GldK